MGNPHPRDAPAAVLCRSGREHGPRRPVDIPSRPSGTPRLTRGPPGVGALPLGWRGCAFPAGVCACAGAACALVGTIILLTELGWLSGAKWAFGAEGGPLMAAIVPTEANR